MPYTEAPGARVPIRMWADPDTVEPAAMDQLRNVTRLPWVHGLAVMPDVHYGKGATVGSVIAMRDAVCPAAVGVDIGCGMTAVKSSLTASELPDDLGGLRSNLEQVIPVGHRAHETPVNPRRVHGLKTGGWDRFWERFDDLAPAVHHRRDRAASQIGTLGGGNHFLEVCLDGAGTVWLILHSGSRNIGKEVTCGWVTDRYGVSWQVIPAVLPDLVSDPDPNRAKRATEAMLSMTKLDIATLEKAHAGD